MEKKTYVRPETIAHKIESTQHLLAASGPEVTVDYNTTLDDSDEQY